MNTESPIWLKWAREIQAIAQTGYNLTEGFYDKENYSRLMRIAAEITAAHTGLEPAEVLGVFRAQPGYATVKVDVRGAVARDGRILLVREVQDGRWCMPGGWADVGECPSESVAREVREESGLIVKPTRVVGVYDANREGRPMEFFHAFKVVMLCDIEAGEPTPSEETSEVGFFSFDDLPDLSRHRTGTRHLDDVRACLADPLRPAAFD